MIRPKPTALWSVFFCSLGSVCAGPAFEAIAQNATSTIEPMTGDEVPINLFDEDDDTALPNGQTVNVGSFGEIDLHVKDLDLTKVLQLLSIQSERNIIASRNVVGTVSADLYNVDFYDALEAILTANGFGYTEKGDFIYVYTAEEIQALEEANRQVITRVYRLNYLTAADAAAMVTPMLSDAGQIGVSAAPVAGFQPSISDGGENSFAAEATLVIRDYPENVDEVLMVLQDLDQRPRQVLVESTILQARLTENNAFGIDFSVVADIDLTNFASPLNIVDELLSGDTGDSGTAIESTVGSNTVQSSGFKVGFLGSNVAAFVQALDQVTDVTVLARPKMLVLNRQRGELLIGGRLGYLSTTQTETSTTQTVEFLDEGTSLTVRPFISQDDFVRLEMRPSLSDASIQTIDGNVIPNETVQEIVTNVVVESGQTVVLGGLFKEETSISREQIPGLGDVPLLGAVGKGQNDVVQRDEVIFMIKPTIMKDNLMADAVGEIEQGITAARIGARNALLPWSRSKWTSSLLKQAYQARAAGDTDKAMWYTKLVLNNEPTNIEAVELKAELTDQSMLIYDRSLLETATDTAINGAVDVRSPIQPQDTLDPGVLDDPVFPWSNNDTEPAAPTATAQVTRPGVTNAEPYVAPKAGLSEVAEPVALEPAEQPDFDAEPQPEFAEAGFAEPEFTDAEAQDEFVGDDAEVIESVVEVFQAADEAWSIEPAEGADADDAFAVQTIETETAQPADDPYDWVGAFGGELVEEGEPTADAQQTADADSADDTFDEGDAFIVPFESITEVPTDTE
ncbi:MAG: secretin N-terminal domain-containing protein [Planctomycetota bacterium]